MNLDIRIVSPNFSSLREQGLDTGQASIDLPSISFVMVLSDENMPGNRRPVTKLPARFLGSSHGLILVLCIPVFHRKLSLIFFFKLFGKHN